MTQKHYNAISKVLKEANSLTNSGGMLLYKDDLVNELCKIFEKENAKFDANKFKFKCGLKDEKQYRVYDVQLKTHNFQGIIFDSKQQAIDQIVEYFSVDHTTRELITIRDTLETDGEYSGLVIEEVEE